VAPATLDRSRVDPRHRTLIAQSFELADDSCPSFRPERRIDGLRSIASGEGSVTLTVQADRQQFVNVAIEVREGCIVAMHFEQASAEARE
jgi:hypothetical protein